MSIFFRDFKTVSRLGPILLALFLAAPSPAKADDIYTIVIKKQEQKNKSHWTLEDWLETRDRMRLMDLWLALHTPTPYEYYVGADYQWGQQGAPTANYNAFRAYGAAYASIVGLEVQRTMDPINQTLGLFDLRIFGYHQQSTNITIQGGIKYQSDPNSYRQAVLGAAMSIYMSRYFGVEGLYRHSYNSTPNTSGMTHNGDRWEGGAFIDFKVLRVYGTYFNEAETLSSPGLIQSSTRSGGLGGIRLYF